MLLVKTVIDHSPYQGLGLFAAEPIPVGTPVWEFKPIIDHCFTVPDFIAFCESMPRTGLHYLLTYCYKRDNLFYYVSDNIRFTNHTEKGHNLELKADTLEIAGRDIAAGEELLENYRLNYDDDDYFFFEEKGSTPEEYLAYLGRTYRLKESPEL